MYKIDMTVLKPNLIRAARAVLDWNRDTLAEKAGLSPVTIANIELGKTDIANAKTYDAIQNAFLGHGVVFTPNGVEQRNTWIREVTGENFFLEALDDIYNTLVDKGGEVLSIGADDRLSGPPVVQRLKKAKNSGIKMRDIVEQGNTFLLGPVAHYKWMPTEFFKNYVKKIYADKVFLDFGDRGLLIHNHEIAEVERNQFNLLWKLLPKIDVESTAHERI